MNRFTIVGRLGDAPRRFGADSNALGINLATQKRFRRDNERVEVTVWNDVVFFDKLADVVEQYLGKGDKILVEGSVQRNCYEKNGNKIYSTDLVARNVEFLITKGQHSQNQSRPNNYDLPGVQPEKKRA